MWLYMFFKGRISVKQKGYLLIVILFFVLFGVVGSTYAYWKYSDTQDLVNVVGTKCLQLTMHNETDGITITDAAPMSDEKGKTQEGYTFTIKNTCNTIAYYQVNLEEELENNIKRLSNEYIKVSLNESEGKLLSKYEEVDTTIKEEDFTSDESHKLTSDRLNPNEEKEYTLKLWMADSTPAIEEVMDATFESKVSIIAVSKEEEELENTITISYIEPEYYSRESEEVTITATSETYNLIEYSLDKEIWNSFAKEGKEATITQSYTIENTYPIYFKDEAGNIKEQDIVTNKLDQTGPEISIEETNDDEGAVVNITFNDPKSGLYEYKIKDEVSTVDIEEGWTLLEEANTQTIQYHSNVNKPIHITVKDKLENENTKDYDITKADTKGPEVTITNPKEGIWTSENVTITVNATDDISGVDKFYYRKKSDPEKEWQEIDLENIVTDGTFGIATLVLSESQETIYEFKVTDKLNNESQIESSIVKIDKTFGVATFAKGTSGTYMNDWYASLNVKVTVTDNESGVVSAMYCTTTDSTCNPNIDASLSGSENSKVFDVTLSNNLSAQRVCTTVVNGAGATSEVICDQTAYKVDAEIPTGITFDISGTLGSNGWYKEKKPTITISATDSQSGVSSIKYCITTETNCTTYNTSVTGFKNGSGTLTLSDNVNGQKICAQVVDNVGNSTTKCSGTYKVDSTKPTLASVSLDATSSGVTITANTPKDSTSQIDTAAGTYTFTVNDGSKNIVQTSARNTCTFTGLEAKAYTITVTVKDKAGNVSAGVSNKLLNLFISGKLYGTYKTWKGASNAVNYLTVTSTSLHYNDNSTSNYGNSMLGFESAIDLTPYKTLNAKFVVNSISGATETYPYCVDLGVFTEDNYKTMKTSASSSSITWGKVDKIAKKGSCFYSKNSYSLSLSVSSINTNYYLVLHTHSHQYTSGLLDADISNVYLSG